MTMVLLLAVMKRQGIVHAGEDIKSNEGDWLLYLIHVHRTTSMRAHRWIWSLCKEIKRAHGEHCVASGLADEGSNKRKRFDWGVRQAL